MMIGIKMSFDYYELMGFVLLHARKSPDPSTQNAAILVNNMNPLWETLDCNRFPNGVTDSEERWERPIKYHYVSHAESNALNAAAANGIKTADKVLVSPWAACDRCAVQIINSGIKKVVTLHRPEAARWTDSIHIADIMLFESGVTMQFLDPVTFGVQILQNGELVIV